MQKKYKITVLGLGHLPAEYGGKQKTGLSYAIYEIARNIGIYNNDIDYVLCCTDYNSKINKIIELDSGIKVIGWRRIDLLQYIFRYPLSSLLLTLQSLKYILKYKHLLNLIKVFGTLIFYSSVLRKHCFDILHVHGANNAVLTNHLYNLTQPKIISLHGVIGFDKNLPKSCRRIEKSALESESYFTFISKETKNKIINNYNNEIKEYEIIPNGIDFKKFKIYDSNKCRHELKLPFEKKIFLTIGSSSRLKGQNKIIEAAALLSENIQEKICLILIGNNVTSIKKNVSGLKCDLFLYEYITQDDLVKFYNSADYHLSASSSEGFGMVLTESLACGTPIIIPETCDIRKENFIKNKINTLIYEKPDTFNIKNVIEKSLDLEFNKNKIRESVSHLSWENVIKDYCKLFREISYEKK